MSSSNLTDEQRRRIEENRLRAIELRNASIARQNASAPPTNMPRFAKSAPAISMTVGTTQGQPSMGVTGPTKNPFPQQTNKTFPPGPQNSVYTSFSKQLSSNPHPTASASSNYPTPNIPFSGKTVTGVCTLISRDRFKVDMGYHTEAINVFKSIPGNSYDAQTRKWTFPLAEHGNLITGIDNLKPHVAVAPLPNSVLRIFRNISPRALSTKIDPRVLDRIDPALVTDLFEFQKQGICFGVARGGRLLLADDMGLGKTIQALGIAHYFYSDWPLLIVTPSSMRYSWRESIWKWLPSVPAGSVAVLETSRDVDLYSVTPKVVISSYDLVGRNPEQFKSFKTVIFDESHNIKNFKTARAKAAVPIIQQSRRAILLSGTPALSRPMELYTQVSAIDRTVLPIYNDYGVRYCNGKKNQWGWDFSGSSNMEELQLVLEETVMIRRLKTQVLAQLPSKLRQMLILDPELVRTKLRSLQAKASAFNEGKHLKGVEKRGKLLEYYAETANAKLEAVVNYVKELVEGGKKFLCFAHHQTMLNGISEALFNMKCKHIRIDGSVGSEERKKLCDSFQLDPDVKVAVLSITAANSGITLTSAHLVVFAELFWNPGILTQAEDRAHRIGQEDSVLVQYLVAKGTVDDVLWPMVAGKLDVLNKAGLSKDNFHEADAEALKQSNISQKSINDYFKPTLPPSEDELDVLLASENFDDSFNTIAVGAGAGDDDDLWNEME